MRQAMRVWTEVLARHVGMREAPKFEWPPLFEDTPKEIAEAFKAKAEGWNILVDKYAADEDEMRKAFDSDPAVGELPGSAARGAGTGRGRGYDSEGQGIGNASA